MHREDLDLRIRNGGPDDWPDKLAASLEWLSSGLGLKEILAPHMVTRAVGLQGCEGCVRGCGPRGFAGDAGILDKRGPDRAPWMRGLLAGDMLATVAAALNRRGAPEDSIGVALAALAGVALVDSCRGWTLSDRAARRQHEHSEPASPPPECGYVRFSDAVETVEPDEEELFDRVVQVMAASGEHVRKRNGRALRASHAKPHGFLRGELCVDENLPPEPRQGLFAKRQGLFAKSRSYPVAGRLAQVLREVLDDRRASASRGMAIKMFDLPVRKLTSHAGEMTQDFVLDTSEAFVPVTARTFLAAIAGTEAATPLPEAAKLAVWTASRAKNAALNCRAEQRHGIFYGYSARLPLTEAYHGQCAFRYGDHIATLAVIPDMTELRRLAEEELHQEDENVLRSAVVEWSQEESPIVPSHASFLRRNRPMTPYGKEALTRARRSAPPAHRPLGSVMRAGMPAYEALGCKRREINGQPTAEPRGPAPDPVVPW